MGMKTRLCLLIKVKNLLFKFYQFQTKILKLFRLDLKEKKITSDTDDAKAEIQQTAAVSAINITERKHIGKGKSSNGSAIGRKLKDTVKHLVSSDRKTFSRDDSKSSNCHHHHYKHMISHYNCENAAEKMIQQLNQQVIQNTPNLNISIDFRIKTDENGDKSIIDESSNLFLYLDMHGHASKKG